MSPESQRALDIAVKAAGSQIELCRRIDLPQSSFWTWKKGKGPTPAVVPEMVAITKGEVTAERFRRDVYGWLSPITAYLHGNLPDDARLAGIDLVWHQIDPREAVHFLMEKRGWSRDRSRAAVDFLTDNGHLPGELAA